jgi:hypothetical protein
MIAISRTTRRAVLPAPGDATAARRDPPSDESSFAARGVSATGSFGPALEYGDVTILLIFARVLLLACLRALWAFAGSIAVFAVPAFFFVTPTA